MGTLSQCCCDCCITPEEMPWTEVTLKAPLQSCEPGFDPENPTYLTEQFERQGCCYVAVFDIGCFEETEVCQLWVKRSYNFEYDALFYRTQSDYIDPPDPLNPVNETDCPCIPFQSKHVEFNGKARVWWWASYDHVIVRVTVGKALTQCDGDAEPICRYFIAATYEYTIREKISPPYYYTKKDISCTGVYRDGICSYTNAWTIEDGVDSDTCPIEDNASWGFGTMDRWRFSRVKFYDTLPTGPISFTDADSLPRPCCGGETNCTFAQVPCGLNNTGVAEKCLPQLPQFVGEFDPVCYDTPDGSNFNGFGDAWGCPTLVTDKEPVTVFTESYYVYGPCEFVRVDNTPNCLQDYPGNDYFTLEDVSDGFVITMCGTLNSYCLGGDDPPFEELCEKEGTTGCCFRTSPTGLQAENCLDLRDSCQLDITNYSCSIVTTHYTAGNICLPVPTVTLEFA